MNQFFTRLTTRFQLAWVMMTWASRAVFIGIILALCLFTYQTCKPAPEPIITPTTERTITVEVPVKEIEYRDVEKYIVDDANAKRLLAENARLKVQVSMLSETLANYTAHGIGPVREVFTSTLPPVLQPSTATTVTEFKDWRLHFVHDGAEARYTLTQSFEVLQTLGRNAQGTPVSLVKLFEIGPEGQRLPITDTKTVTVVPMRDVPSWRMSPRIQAGVAYAQASQNASLDKTWKPGGVIGVQWLKRGTSSAAEDNTLAALTPAVFITDEVREFGILPVSYNLGKVPFMPVKDAWISPYVGIDVSKKTTGNIGIAVTATF